MVFDRDRAREAIAAYIKRSYERRRRHSSLRDLSPVRFELQDQSVA
jgi:transposase InsO family protein